MAMTQSRYGELVYRCDAAMASHYEMSKVENQGSKMEDDSQLLAREIGLLDCQDYDIFQKRLAQWGLGENELSLMRLRAIEARSNSLEEVVSVHEIRY